MPEYLDAQTGAPKSFSWGQMIVDTRMRGLPAMIACYCEVKSYDATDPSRPMLEIEMHESVHELKDSPGMRRFEQSLQEFFGEGLQLTVSTGPALKSPAIQSVNKRLGKFVQAYSSFANDDMVNELIKNFGAKIMIESVRPVDPPAPGKKP